ncbi:hypothetical protein [Octadecabacter antarcticus]|nr:hypothetical protein [Octadecabacter antarcticus]
MTPKLYIYLSIIPFIGGLVLTSTPIATLGALLFSYQLGEMSYDKGHIL